MNGVVALPSGFKSLCMYSDLTTMGIGKSKKEAKLESAQQMFIELEKSASSNNNFKGEDMEFRKNPISMLKELHDRRPGIETTIREPKYTDIALPSSFKSLCMYRDFTTMGIGKSKKEAKLESAQQMLIELEKSASSNNNFKGEDMELRKNPVSMLKELHDRRARIETAIREPKDTDIALPSGFKSLCMDFTTMGIGKTEKEAKLESAQQMLIELEKSASSNNNFKGEDMELRKNPVSMLKELHDRRARIETAIREPKDTDIALPSGFKSLCMDFTTMGIGKTEKEAKLESAQQMLIELEKSASSNNNFKGEDMELRKNPVSMLKELHDRRARIETTIREPKYTDTAHPSGFKSLCMYSDFTTIGIGKSKKEAKLESAQQMLIELEKSASSNNNFGTSPVKYATMEKKVDIQVTGCLLPESSEFLSPPKTEEMAKVFMKKYSNEGQPTRNSRKPPLEILEMALNDVNYGMKSPNSPKSKILMEGLHKNMHAIDSFEQIMEELGWKFSTELMEVSAQAGETYVVMLHIDYHFLKICGKGVTLGKAVENACQDGIDALLLFMD